MAFGSAGLPDAGSSGFLLGATAPDFTLLSSDGEHISLSDYRGQNVVLVFLRHFA